MTLRQKSKRGEAAPTAPTPNVARFVSTAPCHYAVAAPGSTGYQLRTAVHAREAGR